MPYSRSRYRDDFDERIDGLIKQSRRASRLKAFDASLRDLVYQCAVLQTSAATESYIKLVIEGWLQKLILTSTSATMPSDARAFIAAMRLDTMFSKYRYTGDEKALYAELQKEHWLWPLLAGTSAIPAWANGKIIHDRSSYPSAKNLIRLFSRLGIPKVIDVLSTILKRDASVMIEGFQSVRTSAAHATPQPLTINDVERLLTEAKSLVKGLDRILFSHVLKHGGLACW